MRSVQNLKVKAKPKDKYKTRRFTIEQQEWIDDLKESLEQVEQHQQGKIKLKSADQLLQELTEDNL